jgi:site-specific recombinase XerD
MAGTRRKPGRMGPHIDGLRDWLLQRGYTPGSVRQILKLVGHLGRWMVSTDVDVSQLNETVIATFLDTVRVRGTRRVPSVRSLRPLLDYLGAQGALIVEAAPCTPLEQLLGDYRTWLVDERGLAGPTVIRYDNLARRFLLRQAPTEGDVVVAGLTAADVVAFLLHESARVSVGATKGRVAELRSLLRFLHLKGLTPTALASAVPPVAGWHDTGIPVGVTAADVQRLLDCCDRSGVGGIRDFAILMIVARLGLRSAEVARLELDDIDWRGGEIVVRGKARRRDRLPLPADVGQALAGYLRDARPATSSRRVFMALKAPMRAIRPDLVSDVTRRACQRAGLPSVGAHRLRHALATEMLRRGAKLVDVSQVLRHRDLATTAIYAKVDLDNLRSVALPWPGAQR